jgi:hypothetical protein
MPLPLSLLPAHVAAALQAPTFSADGRVGCNLHSGTHLCSNNGYDCCGWLCTPACLSSYRISLLPLPLSLALPLGSFASLLG